MRDDRWLLPRRQTEYPTRDLVAEPALHGRREATYLALATLAMIATAALAVAGTRILDVEAFLGTFGVHAPVALLLPLGVIPSALGFLAVMLVCDLYGRRRAGALVFATVVATAALVGLVRATESTTRFVFTLALASGFVTAHVASLLAFGGLRDRMAGKRLVLRAVLASLVAQPLGWIAFGGIAYAAAPADVDRITAVVIASACTTTAAIVLLALPMFVTARILSIYLRVDRRPVAGLPPATIVDEDDVEEVEDALPPRQRAQRAPFSAAEIRFFTEGDQLGET